MEEEEERAGAVKAPQTPNSMATRLTRDDKLAISFIQFCRKSKRCRFFFFLLHHRHRHQLRPL